MYTCDADIIVVRNGMHAASFCKCVRKLQRILQYRTKLCNTTYIIGVFYKDYMFVFEHAQFITSHTV